MPTPICFRSTMNNKTFIANNITRVTHCIFDLDGTLLDTEKLYHNIIREVCLTYDRCYTKQLEVLMCGKADARVFEAVHRELRIPTPLPEFVEIINKSKRKQLTRAPVMPGAESLVKHLYRNSIPLAIATNSEKELLERYSVAKPNFFSMFSHWVTINDPEVIQGKPSPEIYLLAAKRFDGSPEPRKCLVFEDSPTGLKAGIEADMQVVFIPYGDNFLEDDKLMRRATVVLKSLNDFKPEVFGLPPFGPPSSTTIK